MLEYAPTITVLDTAAEVEALAASILIEQVVQKPDSVLTMPTGGTPIGVYRILREAYRAGSVDFGQITIANLDEYWPMDPRHMPSYGRYMDVNLYDHVNVPFSNRHIPNGLAEDPHTEAERYRQLIDSLAIDLGFVSIGPGMTCHVGFNERGSTIDSRVRYVLLDPETVQANIKDFENPADMPEGAITQGIVEILSAERILLIATGPHKALGINRSLTGEIGRDAPASFLRTHPNVHFVLDSAAASLIKI